MNRMLEAMKPLPVPDPSLQTDGNLFNKSIGRGILRNRREVSSVKRGYIVEFLKRRK
jgi:hypothetical protein